MEIIDRWKDKWMIQKINHPGVILEVTYVVGTVVPRNTTSSVNGIPTKTVFKSTTLPVLFNGNLLPKKFIANVAKTISEEYEIVPATHEFYDKHNEGFLIDTIPDFEDVKAYSWSNINNN